MEEDWGQQLQLMQGRSARLLLVGSGEGLRSICLQHLQHLHRLLRPLGECLGEDLRQQVEGRLGRLLLAGLARLLALGEG